MEKYVFFNKTMRENSLIYLKIILKGINEFFKKSKSFNVIKTFTIT